MQKTSLGLLAAETSKLQKRTPISNKKGANPLNDLMKMTTIYSRQPI